MPQVRIDPEVAAQLLAEADGRSLAAEVDRRLRRSLATTRKPPPAEPVQQPTEARAVAVAAPGRLPRR